MYCKVLGGRWGEGHKPGDIIEIDMMAAKVRLEEGDLEMYEEKVVQPVEEVKEVKEVKERFCDFCDSKGVRHKKDCKK